MARLAFLLVCLLYPTFALAQVRSVEVRTPRSFGYFLGDLVQSQVDIAADDGFSLQAASLPKPGPVAHWLDLRKIDVTDEKIGNARHIRLTLTYQSFYAALDTRAMEVPGLTLTLENQTTGGTTTAQAQVPGWSITVSPLREIQPTRREDPADYMRPDGRIAPVEIHKAATAAWVFAGLSLIALGLLARDRAWGPFARRPNRAFAAALRALNGLSRQSDQDGAYRTALLALHRGLDLTDGRRVLADDLRDFLDRHPGYRAEEFALTTFFQASRLAIFGRDIASARSRWPLAQIDAVLRRLSTVERRL